MALMPCTLRSFPPTTTTSGRLVAVVLLDVGDALTGHPIVPDAPRTQHRPRRPRARLDRQLPGPAHAGDDDVAGRDVVADLVPLPREQRPAGIEAADHAVDVSLAAGRADEVRPLDEQRVLGRFRYQPNVATLHTDTSVLPQRRLAWASWNYELTRTPSGLWAPATHYWMNRLQGVSERENYVVSINGGERIAPSRVLRTLTYRHPLFDLGAMSAQLELPRLNLLAQSTSRTFFAGSYFRYGFHEDAFSSAVDVSRLLLGRDPWGRPDALQKGAPAGVAELSPR